MHDADHFSRRQFLLVSGSVVFTFSVRSFACAQEQPVVILEQANGLILSDPTKCVGCKRCELACTEFNDGKASPTIARIKVTRNLQFGPKALTATQLAESAVRNGLIVQDFCRQCPHPVPCANACPNNAIVTVRPTNARVVDPEKCIGCKMCLRACPWDMMSFDGDSQKATKCNLCGGNPKCVEACPAEALSYVSWKDFTKLIPPRVAPVSVVSPEKVQSCIDCHKK